MKFLKPVVGSILLVLGILTLPQVLAASGAIAIQLGLFSAAYMLAAGLVLAGNELGAWGAILIPAITLVIVAGQISQAGAGVEIPLESWAGLLANVVALVGGVLLVRSDKPVGQRA